MSEDSVVCNDVISIKSVKNRKKLYEALTGYSMRTKYFYRLVRNLNLTASDSDSDLKIVWNLFVKLLRREMIAKKVKTKPKRGTGTRADFLSTDLAVVSAAI